MISLYLKKISSILLNKKEELEKLLKVKNFIKIIKIIIKLLRYS
jgi:hypothetical protein